MLPKGPGGRTGAGGADSKRREGLVLTPPHSLSHFDHRSHEEHICYDEDLLPFTGKDLDSERASGLQKVLQLARTRSFWHAALLSNGRVPERLCAALGRLSKGPPRRER